MSSPARDQQLETRKSSLIGKQLFNMISDEPSTVSTPRSRRIFAPNRNEFSGLNLDTDSENDDDDNEEEEEINALEFTIPPPPTTTAATKTGVVVAQSPRWKTVTPKIRPPKLHLVAADAAAAATIPAPVPFEDEDESDLSALTDVMMHVKGKHSQMRLSHGSKSNQYKASKQRAESIAVRERQSQLAKERHHQQQGGGGGEGE